MLEIVKEVNYYELKNELWSGALDTLNTIIENDKFDDLMFLLEELYPEPVEITTLNDLLWFEPEYIYEQLNIQSDDD